ncbi:MAG: hypothetical protein QM702_20675 [Rubrivivax sp.]
MLCSTSSSASRLVGFIRSGPKTGRIDLPHLLFLPQAGQGDHRRARMQRILAQLREDRETIELRH